MQAMPDARQQSFEEIYGPPENFLEIEVRADQQASRPLPDLSTPCPLAFAVPRPPSTRKTYLHSTRSRIPRHTVPSAVCTRTTRSSAAPTSPLSNSSTPPSAAATQTLNISAISWSASLQGLPFPLYRARYLRIGSATM